MKKLMLIHTFIIIMYLFGTILGIGLYFAINYIFKCNLTTDFILIWILILMIISVIIRLKIYKKRDELLSEKEKSHLGVKVFFNLAFGELFFVFFVIFSLLKQK